MSIKIVITATRPDNSAAFWWDSQITEATLTNTLTTDTITPLGITESREFSEDGLTLTRTFIAPSEEAWDSFMAAAVRQPELISARNAYFTANGHSMSLEKFAVETGQTIGDIPDPLTYVVHPAQ